MQSWGIRRGKSSDDDKFWDSTRMIDYCRQYDSQEIAEKALERLSHKNLEETENSG